MSEALHTRLWRRLLFSWRRDQLAQELTEELEFHHEQKQAENTAHGLAASEAATLTRRQMGNVTAAKEQCHDMWSFTAWERVRQDLSHAARMYGRTPVFTAVCILSIALGIGANAAMFSLVNALLVRPLPYSEADRLVRITGIFPRAAVPFFKSGSRTMDIAAVSPGVELNLTGQGEAVRLFGSSASPNFLTVLGAAVQIGRDFQPSEDSPGRDRVVIISHALWTEHFGASPSAVGRIVKLDGIDREIVGVMPPGFSYPTARVQLWIPMRLDPSNFVEYWGSQFMPLIARLRPAVSLAATQGEVRNLVTQFRGTFPYPMARDFNADSTAVPLQQAVVGDSRGKLLVLFCSVGAVLLIACANVAGLLLSRATTRRKELALRTALGAGRARIIRQLLTESVGLSLTGAAFGILFAFSALTAFKSALPSDLPGVAHAAIDWQVMAATTAVALLTGLAMGLAPALSTSVSSLADSMRTGSARSTSRVWIHLRGVIIAGEIALTLVLLVSAGLLLRSVYQLSLVHPGFSPDRILTLRISPSPSACNPREACLALFDRLLRRAATVPGVTRAAVANSVPLDGRVPAIPVDVEDHPKSADFPAPMLWLETVSADYLGLMRIPLLAGRDFTAADSAAAEPVLLIPASTAKRFWPHQSAIGKHIRPTGSPVWRTVVGVVGDVQHNSLSEALPPGVAGAVYLPYSQTARADGPAPTAMTLLVKVAAESVHVSRAVEELARVQDPNVAVDRVQSLNESVFGSIAAIRSTMLVFVSFAAAAIILAAVGIYGLMSYWVSQRTYEIGLRMAVGCTRSGILSMILTYGLRLTLAGIVFGVAAALIFNRFLTALLFGVAANDVLTFAVVTALVLGVAVLAMAFPAWRATRIDPVKTLWAE